MDYDSHAFPTELIWHVLLDRSLNKPVSGSFKESLADPGFGKMGTAGTFFQNFANGGQ